MQAAESKIRNYESEISPLRLEIKKLTERLKIENARAQSYEKDVMVMVVVVVIAMVEWWW